MENEKRRRKRIKGRRCLKLQSKKELSAVVGRTGLDPDGAVRAKMRKKVRKRLRSLRGDGKAEDGSSSEKEIEGDRGVFEESQI